MQQSAFGNTSTRRGPGRAIWRRQNLLPVVAAAIPAMLIAGSCSSEDSSARDTGTSSSSTTSSSTVTPEPNPDDSSTTVTVAPGGDPENPGTSLEYPGPVASPVSFEDTADFGSGATVRIVAAEATEVEAVLAGERSGAGVAVTIEIANGSDEKLTLGTTTVDLLDSTGASATLVSSASTEMPGELEPGGRADATFTFLLPPDQRSDVRLLVTYSTAQTAVVLTGSLPR